MSELFSNQITPAVELSLLNTLPRSKDLTHLCDDLKKLVTLFKEGSFEEILKLSPINIFETGVQQSSIKQEVQNFLDNNSNDESSCFQVFCIGLSALHRFIQSNWLGFNQFGMPVDSGSDDVSKQGLILDAESLLPTTKDLQLLLVAKTILYDLKERFTHFKFFGWWLIRYIFVHQRVLEESSQLLHSAFLDIVSEIDKLEKHVEADLHFSSLLHLEVGYTHLLYGEVQKTKIHFEKAYHIVNFRCEWTGAMGKRTQHQQIALPQLTIKVHCDIDDALVDKEREIASDLPKDIKLDDDTRLNQIAFINKDDNILPDLPPLYQALLIAHATEKEKFCPKDELLWEELSPLLNCILSHPKIWSFHVSSLTMRSKLDATHRRSVERALSQLQELADSLSKDSQYANRRIEYFYVSRMPLEFELQSVLAEVLQSLGAVSSALDIYIRLHKWEGVITCYQQLDKKHRAEEIVRQELAKGETPKLWCLLGNCTDDVSCYEKAWELSQHKSARAQRDWAYYFYNKKQLRESIPHFQESLKLNSLQESVWIRLAFSAMEIEDWEIAASAYRRYCMLNSESFEAWNNVAKCYTKLGQKTRAWKALQEAVKCNYDNWKIWDNLMVVSIDCCEYEEAIRSYNRILDLKEKHVDVQVLKILLQAVLENKEDNYGQTVGRLAPAVQKLLGRFTSQVTNNAQVWEIYADLVADNADTDITTMFRVAQLMQKSYRSAIQEKNWEKDIMSCTLTLSLCRKYVDRCLNLLRKDLSKENLQLASSAKLSLRSAISQVKLCYVFDIPKGIQEALDVLEELNKDLQDKLSNV
ncbi:tetratricopeptide repeat protein 27-like isoform X1 [Daphnia carinata]|uniref:tetratricopeptide repeat protein 27-like isoform X1 n=2 Tax=Daphnia carinata TaxID=120202 RepID=UPI00257BDA69|nr:tetratricopeptide repeat protein 27-like isoform X1 [Daphnia carinata]